MASNPAPQELLVHLSQVTRLSPHEAGRVLEEICAYFTESVEEFVSRRHQELQHEGLANRVIYQRIADELRERRFPAPHLSQRQIWRLIYG